MNDWNPDLYMQFRSERTQPSIDLMNRIKPFEKQVLKEVENTYSEQKNGKVLLPFKRLFFIGYKSLNKAS